MEMITSLRRLAARGADSNKGRFGRVLVVGGSRGMAGAAVLTGSAALRGGAGLVRVAVPGGILATVAVGNPCTMTAPLPEDDEGRLSGAALEPLEKLAAVNDVVALGPGLGRSDALDRLVPEWLRRCAVPLVLDADGLNGLAAGSGREHAGPLIITPHPGEFGRLLGMAAAEVQKNRLELAGKFAGDHGMIVVLKGHRTVVTDGQRAYVNNTGNPGMATAGSGDVLTGVIAALWGQGLEALDAAILGVHVHGLAGDLARDAVGEISLTALDLLEHLPKAFKIVHD